MSARSKRMRFAVRLYFLPLIVVLVLIAIVFGLSVLALVAEALAAVLR